MSRRRSCAVLALAGFLLPAATHADRPSRVVVLDSGEGVPTGGLVTALRLHLGGLAEVGVGPGLHSRVMADRLARASALVTAGEAVLVVWIERTASGDRTHEDYIVYAVGRDPSRSLIEVVRIAADDRTGTVRVMALKVANLVDGVLSGLAAPGDVARSFARHRGARARPRAAYALVIEAGAAGSGLGGDAGAQAGAALALGARRTAGDEELWARVAVRWLGGVRGENDLGQVDVAELGVTIGAGGGARWRGHGVGVELQFGARLLDADAVTVDGRTDRASSIVPFVGLGVHAEVGLRGPVAVRLHLGPEIAGFRQRFLILRQPAVDLGRFRMVGGLSLVWTRRGAHAP